MICLSAPGLVQALTEVLEAQVKHFLMFLKYHALSQAFEEKVLKSQHFKNAFNY